MGEGDQGGQQQGGGEGFLQGWKRKIQDGGWVDKAREEIGNIKVPKGVQDVVENQDWRGIANEAGKVVQQRGVGEIVGGAIFPQGIIANIGGNLIGNVVGKHQARALLNNPQELSSRIVSDFDTMDGNKSGFIDGTDVKDAGRGGLASLFDRNNGVPQIIDKGFSKFANFDGKDPDKGISRNDVELFNIVQNEKALQEKIGEEKWSAKKTWGTVGGIAGLALGIFNSRVPGASLAMTALRIAAPTIGGAWAAGGVASMIQGKSSESHYAGKKEEAQQLVDWLRKEL